MLSLLEGMPRHVELVVACPEGPLAEAVSALGVRCRRLRGTAGSLRLHPRHTPWAAGELARGSHELLGVVRAEAPDLLHANSFRAGLVAAPVARLTGRPLAAHAHDILPAGLASRAVVRTIDWGARVWLANSRHTERSVRLLGARKVARVVLNPVDLRRFDPGIASQAEARARIGVATAGPVLAVVGQITPWKGQDVAIRALARLVPEWPELRLVIAGSAKFTAEATRFDNRAYLAELEGLARRLGVTSNVVFLRERGDVPLVMRAADAVLVPSWEEPFGLVVIEAMALEVPVVATAVGGPSEVIVDGQSGLLAPPRDPERWAAAVARLLADPDWRAALGRRGADRARAEFSLPAYVERVCAAYDAALVEP